MSEQFTDDTEQVLVDLWVCEVCGESGRDSIPECPSCGSMQIGNRTDDVDLPPLWTEDTAAAASVGVDRLFLTVSDAAFIGVDGDEAELVEADLQEGEEPDPIVRPATAENVEELAQRYNDERTLQTETEQ